MPAFTHAELEALLGAYALDAVDGPEAEAVELHLRECPRCRAEVAEHRETAALLGHVGAPAPEGLWDRIASTLEETPPRMAPGLIGRPEGASEASGEVGSHPPLSVVDPPPGAAGAVRPSSAGARRPGWGRAARVRAVAALVAAAAVVIGVLGYELSSVQGQVNRLQAAVTRSQSLHQVIDQALVTAGRQTVSLTSATTSQSAKAVILPGGQGYLVTADLRGLPSTETYQLWGLIGGRAISLGLLGPSPGQGSFQVGSLHRVEELMVTVE
ncbi:MAG: anti-sigma factor domain-containing protein, partial [Acidimicrobiales bacterium]